MSTIRKAPHMVFACDGALKGSSMGVAAVLLDPSTGATFAINIALSACGASSTDAEWLGKILGLRELEGYGGHLTFVTDSIHSCSRDFSNLPKPRSLLHCSVRSSLEGVRTSTMRELWLPSRPPSRPQFPSMARVLQDRAHRLATRACPRAAPWIVPFSDLDNQKVLGWAHGARMFDPVVALDRVVEEALVSRSNLAYPSTLLLWEASMFSSLLEGKGALNLVSTRRAFRLRTYGFMQGSAEVLQSCPWCECLTWSMVKHARGGCPVLDTRLLAASYLFAHAPPWVKRGHSRHRRRQQRTTFPPTTSEVRAAPSKVIRLLSMRCCWG